MNFKLPEAAWERVGEVRKKWKAGEHDLLKLAADGALQLFAFATPYGSPRYRKNGRDTAWDTTYPIFISPETAGRLIHESYVELKEWKTKDGESWEVALGFSPSGPQISRDSLIVYQDERRRFEDANSEPEPKISELVEACLTETERNKLLKQIGGLALLLAEKANIYRNGQGPNASQIANAVTDLLKDIPDANVRGAGASSIRDSIREGLVLLNK